MLDCFNFIKIYMFNFNN